MTSAEFYLNQQLVTNAKRNVREALKEDLGTGDVTGKATIPADQILIGKFKAKEDLVVSGLEIAKMVFQELDKVGHLTFEPATKDGQSVKTGDFLATVIGSGRVLLSGERTALNFLQRLSGVATLTQKYVEAVAGTKAIILDTRKTTPGLRILEKQAIVDGGGQNHRIGLYDMYLIKDNNIEAAGSITKAMEMVRKNNRQNLLIEVEVANFEQLREALALRPDRIMLDNMNLEMMRQAVEITNGQVPLEASGGVNLGSVRDIALTGIDFISVGALTHSAPAVDINFKTKPYESN